MLRYRDPSFPQTNMKFQELEDIEILNIRSMSEAPRMSQQGFEVVNLESDMKYEDFFDVSKIEHVYLAELVTLFKKLYGALDVHFIRHNVGLRNRCV